MAKKWVYLAREVPRAALEAELAADADFLSLGTNDLTQMTFGISCDDAGGKFLREYVGREILPFDPFQRIDEEGVGELVKLCVAQARQANPEIELGACGEHAGDPKSIDFFHRAGLDYVSCSPLRLLAARLAAAQAAIRNREG
jgi:pyruvate,orthophosphate dikinase